jgi:hypothetical protein
MVFFAHPFGINDLGYDLLNLRKMDDAIAILSLPLILNYFRIQPTFMTALVKHIWLMQMMN